VSVPFVYSNNVLTLVLLGNSYTFHQENPVTRDLLDAIRDGEPEEYMLELIESFKEEEEEEKEATRLTLSLQSQDLDGVAVVDDDGRVFVDGEEIHGSIVTRIMEFQRDNLPFENLLHFVENIKKNPSYCSQLELYDFLENKGLPITEDGCFLAYKAVRADYRDKYSGKIDNSPGHIVTIDRGKVDDNRSNACSKGLHVGALDYVYSYGGGDDHIIIVKVNPADVVSVPQDYSCQKCRVCRYEVLRDFTGELKRPLYQPTGEELDQYDDDDDDEYDWDWSPDDAEDAEDDYYEDGDVDSMSLSYVYGAHHRGW